MFEKELTDALAVEGLSAQDVQSALETPKEAKMGDICLPCFKFARTMRLAPPVIATKLLPYVEALDFVDKVEVVGGYLNIFFDRNTLAKRRFQRRTIKTSAQAARAKARRFVSIIAPSTSQSLFISDT